MRLKRAFKRARRRVKRGIKRTTVSLPGGVKFNPLLGVPVGRPPLPPGFRIPPTRSVARSNFKTRVGASEQIKQPLYDFQVYPQAGSLSFKFFQVPQGQGGKTIHDTNMESAGQLPSPKAFAVTSIEIYFFPGTPIAAFGAQAAANFSDDVYNVLSVGHISLFQSSKIILDEAPLIRCPPAYGLRLSAALADGSTLAADSQSRIDYATACGPLYVVEPAIYIGSNENFSVDITFSALVPVAVAGRIGVVLGGILYRQS